MKNIFLCLLTIAVAACAPKGYTINGDIPGAPAGTVVRLSHQYSHPVVTLDSAVVENGRFVLRNAEGVDVPIRVTLSIDGGNEGRPRTYDFFLDNGRMTFSCHYDSLPRSWNDRWRERNITFSGSAAEDEYLRRQAATSALSDKGRQLGEEYMKVYHLPAIEGVFNTREGMDIARRQNAVGEELLQANLAFVRSNPGSAVALYVAEGLLFRYPSRFTAEEVDALVGQFDAAFAGSLPMQRMLETAETYKKTARGVRFHDLRLTALDGQTVRLSDYVIPGRYNMLEFWASWCGPCRGEIPHLRHLVQTIGNERFNLVNISIDEREQDWKQAVDEERMDWPQLADFAGWNGAACGEYGVQGVPFSVILDHEGRIIHGSLRGAELDAVVADLLGVELE